MAQPAIQIIVQVKDEASAALLDIQKLGKQISDTLSKDAGKETVLKRTSKDAKQAKTDLDKTKKAAEQTGQAFKKTGSQKFTAAKEGIKQMKEDLKDLRDESKVVNATMSKLGKGLGAAIGALGLGAAINEVRQFGKAIAEVSTLVDTAVVSQENLSEAARDTSTAYGTDAVETANALYQAISGGAEAGAEANELLDVATRTAIGGVTDQATAVDGLTDVINAYGKEMSDAEQVADVMFTTMKGGKTTIGELSSSLYQAAPLAASMGVSFEELSAMMIALTKSGVPTAQAMTQVRAAMQGLAQSKDALQLFKDLGHDSAEAAIRQDGLIAALQKVQEASDGSISKMQKYLSSIEGVQAATVLTANGGQAMSEAMEDVANSTGAANKAFEKINDTLDQDFKKLVASLSALLGQLGSILEPAVRAAVQALTSVISAITEFLQENETLVSAIGTVLGAVVAAWAGFKALKLTGTIAGIAKEVLGLTEAFKGLTGIASSVIVFFTQAGGLVAGLTDAFSALKLAVVSAGKALLALVVSNPVVAGIVAIGAALTYGVTKFYEWKGAQEEAAAATALARQEQRLLREELESNMSAFEQYKDVRIQGDSEIAESSLRELNAYKEKLQGAQDYYEAQAQLIFQTQEFNDETIAAYDAAQAKADEYGAAVDNLNVVLGEMNAAANAAYIGNNALIKSFEELSADGKEVTATLKGMFAELDFQDQASALTIIQALGNGIQEMGDAFQDAIKNKTIPDLLALMDVMETEFDNGKLTITQFKNASSEILRGLFAQVGVEMQADLQELDNQFIAAFDAIIASGQAGVQELRQVIENGLNNLRTAEGLDALEQRLNTLFKQGIIEAAEYEGWLEKSKEAQAGVSEAVKQTEAALKKEQETLARLTSQIQRESSAELASIDAKIRKTQSALDVANALGNESEATRLQMQLSQQEIERANANAAAKQKVADAARENANSMAELAAVLGDEITPEMERMVENALATAEALQFEADAAEGDAEAMRDLARAKKEATQSTEEAGDAAETARVKVDGFMQVMIDHVQGWRDYLAEFGPKVVEYFNMLDEGFKKGSSSATTLSARIDNVKKELYELETSRILRVNNLAKWFQDVSIAARKTELRFLEQSSAAERLTEKLERTQYATEKQTDAWERSVDALDLLDDATLDSLKSQIESVRAASESLKSSIESTVRSLRIELADLRGELEAVEELDYAQRKAELEEQLERAEAMGDSEAIKNAREALGLAREIHDEKMDNIEEERAAEQAAAKEERANQQEELDAVSDTADTRVDGIEAGAETSSAAHGQRMAEEREYQEEVKKTGVFVSSSGGGGGSGGGSSFPRSNFAQGGPVRGPGTSTSDSILARLSHGEWVMDARTVKYWGGTMMRALQMIARGSGRGTKFKGGLPSFASGGPVSGTVAAISSDIDRVVKQAGGGTVAPDVIQVEITAGNQRVTGTYEKEDQENLLDILSGLQARA